VKEEMEKKKEVEGIDERNIISNAQRSSRRKKPVNYSTKVELPEDDQEDEEDNDEENNEDDEEEENFED
jgi:hypothetical protein